MAAKVSGPTPHTPPAEPNMSVAEFKHLLKNNGSDPKTIEKMVTLLDNGIGTDAPEEKGDGSITESELLFLANSEQDRSKSFVQGLTEDIAARVLNTHVARFVDNACQYSARWDTETSVTECRDEIAAYNRWFSQYRTFMTGIDILQNRFGWTGDDRIPLNNFFLSYLHYASTPSPSQSPAPQTQATKKLPTFDPHNLDLSITTELPPAADELDLNRLSLEAMTPEELAATYAQHLNSLTEPVTGPEILENREDEKTWDK